ncbi:MAG: hypothetical protein JKY88_17705 [Pseudomonadales bacterium]|nr:hypothetical protein [Pseudomonadales bacterium]
MLIAIDYDKTITADRLFWHEFLGMVRSRGHYAIVATGRKSTAPIDDGTKRLVMSVVYCGDRMKSWAVEQAGYNVDIWIDDEPGHIEPQRKLSW